MRIQRSRSTSWVPVHWRGTSTNTRGTWRPGCSFLRRRSTRCHASSPNPDFRSPGSCSTSSRSATRSSTRTTPPCVAGSGCERRWRVRSTPCWRSPSSRPRQPIDHLRLDRARVATIGTGVSARFVPPDHPTTRTGVVAVTGADERKNTRRLVEAWGRLPVELRRRHRLSVVAEVPPSVRERWLTWAVDAGCDDSVEFTGGIDDEHMVRLLQTAALAVMPSIDEGFGLPVAEAAACGCPVDLLCGLVAAGGDRPAGRALRSDGSGGDRNRDRTWPDRHGASGRVAGGFGPRWHQVALACRRPQRRVRARPHRTAIRDRAGAAAAPRHRRS